MAGQIPKRTVVYGCAGASNTGQLANAAAVRMTRRGTGRIGCLGGVASGQKGFVTAARLADEVVAIDGCEVGCAKKTLETAGVAPDRHVVVSDLGIGKTGDLTLRDEEIDRVVMAAETAPSTGTTGSSGRPTTTGAAGAAVAAVVAVAAAGEAMVMIDVTEAP